MEAIMKLNPKRIFKPLCLGLALSTTLFSGALLAAGPGRVAGADQDYH
jgi:hypothetical protein